MPHALPAAYTQVQRGKTPAPRLETRPPAAQIPYLRLRGRRTTAHRPQRPRWPPLSAACPPHQPPSQPHLRTLLAPTALGARRWIRSSNRKIPEDFKHSELKSRLLHNRSRNRAKTPEPSENCLTPYLTARIMRSVEPVSAHCRGFWGFLQNQRNQLFKTIWQQLSASGQTTGTKIHSMKSVEN